MHRKRHPRVRTRLLALCTLLASCMSSGDPASRTAAPAAPAPAADPIEAEAALPPPPPRDLPGSAPLALADVPTDIVPLTARFAARSLPLPRVSRGHSESFTFDGGRRGFLARLPEDAQMQLLTPAYADGRVYVGGGFGSHQLYAMNAATGQIDWIASAPDGGPTAAIIEGDKVLFNTESCTLFAVDAHTGRSLWSRWLGDPLMGQPAATNGRVFSGHVRNTGGYGFTAMDLEDGHVLWTRWISADVMNAPVLDDDSVYFTTMDGVVWRFDQATGQRVWRETLDATSAPWLDGDQLHVAKRTRREGATDERSVVLAKADGSLVREQDSLTNFLRGRPDTGGVESGWAFEGSRPTIVDGRFYQTIGDEVQSRDAASGELLWRRRYTDATHRRPASPPAVAGGQLVFGTRDGILYGLDIDSGMTTFAYDVGAPIVAQPTVAAGWVYASTIRGTVIGLEVADRTVGGWHMWGGDARHNGPVEETALVDTAVDPSTPARGFGALELTEGDERVAFPLTGTRVEARIAGFAARVRVEQTFENPYDHPVEAVYLLPLPDDAAVDSMVLETAGRRILGQIRRREEARREYRQARERGALASLLEQERPNLFRQAVANLRPHEAVRVVVTYNQALPYEAGSYRFVFPMAAGVRPIDGRDDEPALEGRDAIDPATRRDRVDVSILADVGGTLHEITSPTHTLSVERTSARAARVRLDDVMPDRDLDVRFRVAGDEPDLGLLASPPHGDAPGYATLLLHPRLDVPASEISKRELVVVIDTSSSMRGRPLELARAAALRAIAGLRETDTFRVVRFSDRASEVNATPLPATPANVARARDALSEMTALGTTELRRGLATALGPPIAPDRIRIVALFTDGYIGNESEVLRETDRTLGNARLFAFGVGSAVNRYLLSRLAEVGRGDLSVVTLSESPEEAADAFHDRIGSPYLTDLELSFSGISLDSVYPRRAPDLFADRPLVIHGRYAVGGHGQINLRGRIGGQPFERVFDVTLPSEGEDRSEVRTLWARTRIRDLMTQMSLAPSDALREEVTDIGLTHSLMTQWTSFIAIDEGYPSERNARGVLPSGVDYAGDARLMEATGGEIGFAGLSMSGTGYGGGGVGYGTIGVGSVGTIGGGGEAIGALMGDGVGNRDLGRRVARVPMIRAGRATVVGSLSRIVVRRVVQRQLPRIRTCYEQRLVTRPDLAGRVTVQMVIAADGHVLTASIASSSLADETVEACVEDVVRSLTFPEVAGGSLLAVTYPFMFSTAEEDEASP